MNRQQWKAQQYGSQVNSWWLTWGDDQRRKRKLENADFIKDVLFFLACIAAIAIITWGIA